MTSLGARLGAALILAITVVPTSPTSPAAPPPPAIRWVGYLANEPSADVIPAFRQALHDRGWTEGRNVGIVFRYAQGKPERFPGLAAELVRLRVDVIVAEGPAAVAAAQEATRTIPTVMAIIGDAVGAGLVTDRARPGGNLTGVTTFSAAAGRKRLTLMRQVLPALSTVAVLWNPGNRAMVLDLRETEVVARTLGLRVVVLELPVPRELDDLFGRIKKEGAGALLVLEPVTALYQKRIAAIAEKNRVPTFWLLGELLDIGGVLAYGPLLGDLARSAAGIVDRLLRGVAPGAIPLTPVSRAELVINLRTARALDLPIPRELLRQAAKVIQ